MVGCLHCYEPVMRQSIMVAGRSGVVEQSCSPCGVQDTDREKQYLH
jgi:hypothetical protein